MRDKETSPLRKKARLIILAVSAAILGFAFGVDWIGLSEPGNFSKGQMLLAATSLLLAIACVLGHRIVAAYKGLALLLLNTMVAFVMMEFGATLILKVISRFPSAPEPNAQLSYYNSQEWGAEYWREFGIAESNRYEPWVVWRRRPFSGKTINVNQEGIRLTPGADSSANSYKVFAFGGSTLWGVGAPDWGTIPAYLQAKLDSLIDRPVCVVNFGESAYVSTQGVIELLKQLQSGNVPEVAVFYDGFNDIVTAWVTGEAEAHHNLSDIAARFKGGSLTPPHIALLNRLSLVTLFKRFKTEEVASIWQSSSYADKGVDVEIAAAAVARVYLGNYELVDALARKYGFEYHFFWQPAILVTEKKLTREEQLIKAEIGVPAAVALFQAGYRRIKQAANEYPNLHYIADAYDNEKDMIWIDTVHVTPIGNQLVAKEILKVLRNGAISHQSQIIRQNNLAAK